MTLPRWKGGNEGEKRAR